MTDPHLLGPDLAPTPFTASEIRVGCPPGRTTVTLVSERGVEPYQTLGRFVTCDEEGADCTTQVLSGEGEPTGEPTAYRSTWSEFQGHAAFPAGATTIRLQTIAVGAGVFECRRYTVARSGTIAEFWFALDKPGMPIRVVITDDEGPVRETEMLEDYVADS